MKTPGLYLYTNVALLEKYLTRCAIAPEFSARQEYISLSACINGAIMLTHKKLSRKNVLSTCQNGSINPVIAEIDPSGYAGECILVDAEYKAVRGTFATYDAKKHLCALIPSSIPTTRIVKLRGVEQNLNLHVYDDLYLPDMFVSTTRSAFGKATIDTQRLCAAAADVGLPDMRRQCFLADKLKGALLGFCGNCHITKHEFSANTDGNIFAMMSRDPSATLTEFLRSKDRYGEDYALTKDHSFDPSADPYVYDIISLLKAAFADGADAGAIELPHKSFKEDNVCLLLYCAICACRDIASASYKSVDAEQWADVVSDAFLKMRAGRWSPEEDERVNLFAGIRDVFKAGFARISGMLDGSASREQYSPLKALLFFSYNITNSLHNLTANAVHFGLTPFETSIAKMLYGACYGVGVFDKAYKSDLTLVRAADEIVAETLPGILPPLDRAKFRAANKLPFDAEHTDRGFRVEYRDDAYVGKTALRYVKTIIAADGVDASRFPVMLSGTVSRELFLQIVKALSKRSAKKKQRTKKENAPAGPSDGKRVKPAKEAEPEQMTLSELFKEDKNGTET